MKRAKITKPRLGLAAGALSLMATASLLVTASSFGAVSCTYSGADHVLSVDASNAFVGLTRFGDAIRISDGNAPISCAGGSPTTFNTDRVQVTHSGRRADRVDLAGGQLAPGATPESQGISEIEVQYLAPTSIDVSGTGGGDQLTLGPASGINVNGDDDADLTGPFTSIVLEGLAGDDLIAPQADYSGAGAHLVVAGSGGNDTLVAPPGGAVLHGGAGRDVITGSPRRDNITGGIGPDLIRAGKGGDVIRAIDGTRDRILCGGGFDKVKVDGIDKLKGCEKLIAVKAPHRR